MINKPFAEVSAADVEALVTNSATETSTLEFKRQLPGTADGDKKEFLADVSALANTSGGDLIFGLEEVDGCAAAIVGIGSSDVDAEILRLDSLITAGLEPRIRHQTKFIVGQGGTVILIRAEKSWNAPHRVVFKGHDKFYGRTSAGKFSLDVQQLRNAFTDNVAVAERLRSLRADRMIDIIANRTPLTMGAASKLVLHILPFETFASAGSHDLSTVAQRPLLFEPLNASGWNQRITLEGILAYSMTGQVSRSYLHVYRNGIIEAVEGSVLNHTLTDGRQNLPSIAYERLILKRLPDYLKLLQEVGVQAPLAICLSLTDIKGAILGRDGFYFDDEHPVLQDHLILREVVLDSYSDPFLPAIRSLFDLVWNACGIERSANFNSAGEWSPPTRY